MRIGSGIISKIYLLYLPLLCFGIKFFLDVPGKVLFDVFTVFLVLLGLGLLPFGGLRFTQTARPLLLIFFCLCGMFLVKALFGVFCLSTEFYWVPFLRESKPIVYFLFAFLLVARFGIPDLSLFDRFGKLFALLVLLDFAIGAFTKGVPYRPFICDESNYDNVIILVGYLIHIGRFGLQYNPSTVVYFAATLASQSKTGVIVFLVITVIMGFRTINIKSFVYIISGVLSVFAIWMLRMSSIDTIGEIDRVRMWLSYFDLIQTTSISKFFFGFMPGVPLRHDDPYLGWFIWYQVEHQLGATGLHAFNFHSMWLRLLATYGIVGTAALAVIILTWVPRNRLGFALLALIALQGFSLGVFYLSTVAPILLMVLASVSATVPFQICLNDHQKVTRKYLAGCNTA